MVLRGDAMHQRQRQGVGLVRSFHCPLMHRRSCFSLGFAPPTRGPASIIIFSSRGHRLNWRKARLGSVDHHVLRMQRKSAGSETKRGTTSGPQ